jgi:hypothetical protein
MVAVTVDSRIRSQFADAPSQVEVRDEQGMLLGYFTPGWLGTAEDYRRARERIDRAELERRKALPEPGITTQELMSRLHARKAN